MQIVSRMMKAIGGRGWGLYSDISLMDFKAQEADLAADFTIAEYSIETLRNNNNKKHKQSYFRAPNPTKAILSKMRLR